MRDWNTNVLIGFGFVLGGLIGFTIGIIAAPYWIEIKVLESGAKAPAVIEGYGDIFGGLLGGGLAVAAAISVFMLEHDKAKRAEDDLKAVLAYNLLKEIHYLFMITQALDDTFKNDVLRGNFVEIYRMRSTELEQHINRLQALPPVDPKLGVHVTSIFTSFVAGMSTLINGVRECPDSIAKDQGTIQWFHSVFRRDFEQLKYLVQLLEQIRAT